MFDLGSEIQRSGGRGSSRGDRKHFKEAWRHSYAGIQGRWGKPVLRAGMARRQHAQTWAMSLTAVWPACTHQRERAEAGRSLKGLCNGADEGGGAKQGRLGGDVEGGRVKTIGPGWGHIAWEQQDVCEGISREAWARGAEMATRLHHRGGHDQLGEGPAWSPGHA